MSYVKSPYNFVPAPNEDEVFKPDWADQVSHDIPFSDGESGEIEIEITAETPIFIRDGQKKDEKAEEFSHFMVNGKKQYFIPATSIKGMVRNVLEIMSFSRLAPVALGNTIFGLRDMNNHQYSKEEIRGNQPGWLVFENGKWIIKPTRTDRVTINSIVKYFSHRNSWDKEEVSFSELTARGKYEKCGLRSFEKKFNMDWSHEVEKTGDIFELNRQGEYDGYLVMYGAMDNKKYEYIFEDSEGKSIDLIDQNLLVKMTDYEEGNSDSLWLYFFKELGLKKIPVFYKQDPQTKKAIHFGFSKLYRLNNGAYLKDLNPISSYKEESDLDLAETIFGHTSGNEALKGRVFFSHALALGNPEEDELKHEILGSPKPSYYPFYLDQNNRGQKKYNTYQNPKSQLRGFKKYHIQQKERKNVYTQDQLDSDTMVHFKPLKSGTKFRLKIRYHNLRPFEIGSLLSALTYHANHQILRHNLGMAKSMGYGRIKFDLHIDDQNLKRYLKIFESKMDEHTKQKFGKKWVETDQIRDLGAMAKAATENNKLNFPKLEAETRDPRSGRTKKINEFNEIKKGLEFLKSPSTYNSFQIKAL